MMEDKNVTSNISKNSATYPRQLIILLGVAIVLFAIIETYVMTNIIELRGYVRSLMSLSFGDGSIDDDKELSTASVKTLTVLFLKFGIDIIIISLFVIYLLSWMVQFTKSKFSTFDTDDQKLLREGTNDPSDITITNFLWYRKNGIPFHQILTMSLLFVHFLTYHFYIYASLKESYLYTEGAHVFSIINFVILGILAGFLFLLKDKLSLDNLPSLNTFTILFTGFLAFTTTSLVDSEAMVLVSTILILPSIVFSIAKIRRPIKIRIDDHQAGQRYLSKELPDLEEGGISKWVLVGIGLSLIYLSLFAIVIYFEYYETVGVINRDLSMVTNAAIYFSIVIIIEAIVFFILVSRFPYTKISKFVKYSIIFFALTLVAMLVNDNFFFALNRYFEQFNVGLGGLLVQIVIPTGILIGMSLAYLYKFDDNIAKPTESS